MERERNVEGPACREWCGSEAVQALREEFRVGSFMGGGDGLIAEAWKGGGAEYDGVDDGEGAGLVLDEGMPLIEEKLSERILGCCIQVHRTLGPGFLESIYEEALALELRKAGLAFERQKAIGVFYDGKVVGEHRLDYAIEGRIVLELKTCKAIDDVYLAVAKSYLKAAGLPLALVVNFARPILEIRRVVLTI